MNDLGSLLKKLRGTRTLREVAELTALSHTYISDIEKGYRRGTKKPIHPSPDTLKRFAEAYDYSYEDLMKVAGYLDGDEQTDGTQFDKFDYYRMKIAKEFPDIDLMFKDLAKMSGEDLEEVYEYIKFKMSQKD